MVESYGRALSTVSTVPSNWWKGIFSSIFVLIDAAFHHSFSNNDFIMTTESLTDSILSFPHILSRDRAPSDWFPRWAVCTTSNWNSDYLKSRAAFGRGRLRLASEGIVVCTYSKYVSFKIWWEYDNNAFYGHTFLMCCTVDLFCRLSATDQELSGDLVPSACSLIKALPINVSHGFASIPNSHLRRVNPGVRLITAFQELLLMCPAFTRKYCRASSTQTFKLLTTRCSFTGKYQDRLPILVSEAEERVYIGPLRSGYKSQIATGPW